MSQSWYYVYRHNKFLCSLTFSFFITAFLLENCLLCVTSLKGKHSNLDLLSLCTPLHEVKHHEQLHEVKLRTKIWLTKLFVCSTALSFPFILYSFTSVVVGAVAAMAGDVGKSSWSSCYSSCCTSWSCCCNGWSCCSLNLLAYSCLL